MSGRDPPGRRRASASRHNRVLLVQSELVAEDWAAAGLGQMLAELAPTAGPVGLAIDPHMSCVVGTRPAAAGPMATTFLQRNLSMSCLKEVVCERWRERSNMVKGKFDRDVECGRYVRDYYLPAVGPWWWNVPALHDLRTVHGPLNVVSYAL